MFHNTQATAILEGRENNVKRKYAYAQVNSVQLHVENSQDKIIYNNNTVALIELMAILDSHSQ